MSCPFHAADGVPLIHAVPEDVQADRERLYQEGPLTRVELPGGVRAWATTHHEVSKATLNDPRFVKSVDHWADYQEGRVPEGWPLLGTIPTDNTNMLALDGAPHRRLRQLTASPFSARRVERLRPRIERITARALDALEPRASQTLDLKSEFTFRVPMAVIGELYGVSEAEYENLGEMYAKLFSGTTEEGEHLRIYHTLFQYFGELVARKRATLDEHDDFTADLIRASEDGEGLTDMEITLTLLTVVAAGHETTVNLLTNVVRALLRYPEQLERLRKGEVTWDAVVEETLRYDPPNNLMMFRFATEDIEIEGQTIKKGEALLTHYGAASRDRAEFGDDPEVFDPDRGKGRHISFGYGPHICPGAPLSRLEAGIILPMLFERFPDLRLAVPDEELVVASALSVNSLKEFPVVLRP
ncbi:cytochrome P450 family protein [Nocardiopsis changdeensis]|uniref:Cytochrome P450 n=1 Tax=Nocardiopsis changdeensis TaxID=2831969 RepID=A0ABX8BRK9_9ACTN|nr:MULTISPECIES: cytochrome P450 [Nocardiopsis]QUX24887.1 cytochrome P450 [Nocardiopsis changdeensis]QYX35273.1 cytochrome P450 [Nocardiopsis sp. MT53]